MNKVLARAALLLLVAGFGFTPDAQSQRRRTSRRTTNPARQQPVQAPNLPDEPTVVSTADDAQPATPRRATSRARQQQGTQAGNSQPSGAERELSAQVEQLTQQINQLKADQKAMYDLERLTRAEQRAEQFRTQLREVTDREFQLQERLAEIEYESRPDAIQQRAALVGTLNPSAVRDAIAQQLVRERARINKQLELLAASRTRLEASVATADAEVEQLRRRVEANDQAQQPPPTPGTGAANAATTAAPQPSPSPTPAAQPPM